MLLLLKILLLSTLFGTLIFLITRRKKNSINSFALLFGYAYKVAMGCLHGFLFMKYYPSDDTILFNHQSVEEYHKLLSSPGTFFSEINLLASFRRNPSLMDGWHYLLSDLENWCLVKPLGLFNLVSHGNYFQNIVFFNFITFWGSYLLFKLFCNLYPENKIAVFIASFFIPSICFWLSGIRTEGLLLLTISLSLYYFQTWLQSKRIVHLLYLIVGLLGTVVFRIQFFMILLFFLFAWRMAINLSRPAWKTFTVIFIGGVLIFFGSSFISGEINLPMLVVRKQQEFAQLKGNT